MKKLLRGKIDKDFEFKCMSERPENGMSKIIPSYQGLDEWWYHHKIMPGRGGNSFTQEKDQS